MRASGFFIVVAVCGASALSIAGAQGCVYSATGQGGTAGAIAIWEGEDGSSSYDNGSEDGSVGNPGPPGSGSGGTSSGGGGASSGGHANADASSGPPIGEDGGGTLCPPDETSCGPGCCEPPPAPDSGGPSQCVPPGDFLRNCVAYFDDTSADAGSTCSMCIQLEEQSGKCVAPACAMSATCENQCGQSTTPAEACTCLQECLATGGGTGCACLQQTDQYFVCLAGPCATACPSGG